MAVIRYPMDPKDKARLRLAKAATDEFVKNYNRYNTMEGVGILTHSEFNIIKDAAQLMQTILAHSTTAMNKGVPVSFALIGDYLS